MSIKVAITQFSMSEVYDENLAKADSLIAKATSKGAQLVLLPELFEGHYFCQVENYDNFDLAEDPASSKTLKHFEAVAKKYHVVLPISFFEKAGNCFFNSLGVIDSTSSARPSACRTCGVMAMALALRACTPPPALISPAS